jgi:hypothetical protein
MGASRGRSGAVAVLLGLGLGGAGCARTEQPPAAEVPSPEEVLRQATVTLGGGRCAGAVVGDGDRVVTAAHCVSPGEARLLVELHDGRRLSAETLVVDRARDVAVLGLPERAVERPLSLGEALPPAGQALLFAGRNDRSTRLQEAHVERLGRCPSLPGVPQALFTSLDARKGDSGAPLVGPDLVVHGLVHGGARCNIATPLAGTSALLQEGDALWARRHGGAGAGEEGEGVGGSGPAPLDPSAEEGVGGAGGAGVHPR